MIKVNKKALSLIVLCNILLSHVPHASAEMDTKGDKVRTSATVNVRSDSSIDSDVISYLKKNTIAKRILSCDNGWDLIEYNGKLGFVKSEYLRLYTDENIYCDLDFYETRKLFKTDYPSNIYIEPYLEADGIGNIKEDTIIDVLAFTNNSFALVNVNGLIGFMKMNDLHEVNDYEVREVIVATKNVNIRSMPSTSSERYDILYKDDEMPYLKDYNKEFYMINYYGTDAFVSKKYAKVEKKIYKKIDFIKLIYLTCDAIILSKPENPSIIGYLDKYQTCEVLADNGDYYYIRCDDLYGYVHKTNTSLLKGMVVVIDISDQKLMVYEDNEITFKSNVVTGKDNSPTIIGKYNVEKRERDRFLTGTDYETFVHYWIQYNGNYGIHDLDMGGNFGGNTYHKNGSHGCVRMPIIPASKLYQKVKIKTPVIIKK